MQLGAEAIAAGDISAITPYLKALDRLDRYQVVASANQAYDDEARKKLLDKINRVAENLRTKEVRSERGAGGPEGDRAGSPQRRAKPKGRSADPADSAEFVGEASRAEATPGGLSRAPVFFIRTAVTH